MGGRSCRSLPARRGLTSAQERPSLRAGRKFDVTRKIACPIDHNTIHIKWLDAQASARAAGSRGMLLRDAAGIIWVGIFCTYFRWFLGREKEQNTVCVNSTIMRYC